MSAARVGEAAALVARCRDAGWSLAVAESLTGGLLASAVVDVPGASAVFRGGVVSYASSVKASVLGVDGDLLAARGAVDPAVARQMAEGARRLLAADVAIATTGVAGPEPAEGKDVGVAYVAVSAPTGSMVQCFHLSGNRANIRSACVRSALSVALAVLAG